MLREYFALLKQQELSAVGYIDVHDIAEKPNNDVLFAELQKILQ